MQEGKPAAGESEASPETKTIVRSDVVSYGLVRSFLAAILQWTLLEALVAAVTASLQSSDRCFTRCLKISKGEYRQNLMIAINLLAVLRKTWFIRTVLSAPLRRNLGFV